MGKRFNITGLRLGIAGVLLAVLLAACGTLGVGVPDPGPYRQSEPSEYYLYLPEGYTPERRWPVFIGVHGSGGSGLDCWNVWQRYADQEGFILVCPSLADESGGWFQKEGEEALNLILHAVYEDYAIETDFFLAGFSAGGQFVQVYAFNYPGSVSGVSVISAGNYFPATTRARGVTFLVTVGENDTERVPLAGAFVTELQGLGIPVEFEVIPNVGHDLSGRARDLTIELYRQVH